MAGKLSGYFSGIIQDFWAKVNNNSFGWQIIFRKWLFAFFMVRKL
jgi:hypothetical protein